MVIGKALPVLGTQGTLYMSYTLVITDVTISLGLRRDPGAGWPAMNKLLVPLTPSHWGDMAALSQNLPTLSLNVGFITPWPSTYFEPSTSLTTLYYIKSFNLHNNPARKV